MNAQTMAGCDTTRCRYPYGSHADTCAAWVAVPPPSDVQRMALYGPCPRCGAARDVITEYRTDGARLAFTCPSGCGQDPPDLPEETTARYRRLAQLTPADDGTQPLYQRSPGGPVSDTARILARAFGEGALDQALAALQTITAALGMTSHVTQAHTVPQVADMLVAEIARRDTQTVGGRNVPPWLAEEMARRAAGAGQLGGQGGTVGGVAATSGGGGGGGTVWVARDEAADILGSVTHSGTEDAPPPRRIARKLETLVTKWRRTADAEQAKAGNLPPSQETTVARLRGSATAWYAAANQLADTLEPLRTGEDHNHE